MKPYRSLPFAAVLTLTALTSYSERAAAASLTQVTDLGSTPTAVKMYVYVPDQVAAAPALMVLLHSCENTAAGYFGQMNFSAEADKHGFILVYPESPSTNTNRCWDVSSTASLTRDGGGDSQSVVAMVKYALKKWPIDPKRVFSVGGSSGAMITNVLLATYPDVFAGGSAFSGVPYTCFQGSSFWNNTCSEGMTTKTAQAWGDLVRSAYPSYSGVRPRMQLWHGTADDILRYPNFGEEIKQWTNVLGVSETPSSTAPSTPKSPWTRTVYTDSCGTVQVEASSAQGQTHSIDVKGWAEPEVVRFFGLDGTNPIKTCAGGAGGASSGGSANGGTNSGGNAMGGSNNGGNANAGASNGGGANAGVNNGGNANAGASNGGNAGASNGGAGASTPGTAGTATGGNQSGGSANSSSGGIAGTTAGAIGASGGPTTAVDSADGCGCRIGGSSPSRSSAWLALLAATQLVARRRRRR